MARRHTTLASVSKRPAWGIRSEEETRLLLDDATTLVRRAARMGADLLAFPEVYPQLALLDLMEREEPEDGGTLDRIRELAGEHRLYVVWPRYERAGDGHKYNTAVLVGRDGEVIGRQRKMFPTVDELGAEVMPGHSCPVFETDFGRLAMVLCFDLNFSEVRDELRALQPDLVVFSSMYRGGLQCQEWALDLGCHVVTAIGAELGRIVDPGGKILQLSTYEELIVQRVNLNKRQLHVDYNWLQMDAMLERYGPELTFEYYTPEGRFVIGYEREDRDVDEIIREFALEPVQAYFERARRLRSEALTAATAEAGETSQPR